MRSWFLERCELGLCLKGVGTGAGSPRVRRELALWVGEKQALLLAWAWVHEGAMALGRECSFILEF